MKVPKTEYMTCRVCNRVIWVEDGPVCCYCIERDGPEIGEDTGNENQAEDE